jgi:hypothetical protein
MPVLVTAIPLALLLSEAEAKAVEALATPCDSCAESTAWGKVWF